MPSEVLPSTPAQQQSAGGIFLSVAPGLGDEKMIHIKLPDFSGSLNALTNKFEKEIGANRHNWLVNVLNLTDKESQKMASIDLPLLASVFTPFAPPDQYELHTDLMYWFFLFDDPFDEGDLKDNLSRAVREIFDTLAVLDDCHPTLPVHGNFVRFYFQEIWRKLSAVTSKSQQFRYKKYIREYLMGVLRQLQEIKENDEYESIEEYIEIRRGAVGFYPICFFAEWQHPFDLPNEVLMHPSLDNIRDICNDMVWIWNDLFSIRKDMAHGSKSNIVFLFMKQGKSVQEAVDAVGNMLEETQRRWNEALQNLPSWGNADLDEKVMTTIKSYMRLADGNNYWSLFTKRYFGSEGAKVRKTGIVDIPEAFINNI